MDGENTDDAGKTGTDSFSRRRVKSYVNAFVESVTAVLGNGRNFCCYVLPNMPLLHRNTIGIWKTVF